MGRLKDKLKINDPKTTNAEMDIDELAWETRGKELVTIMYISVDPDLVIHKTRGRIIQGGYEVTYNWNKFVMCIFPIVAGIYCNDDRRDDHALFRYEEIQKWFTTLSCKDCCWKFLFDYDDLHLDCFKKQHYVLH